MRLAQILRLTAVHMHGDGVGDRRTGSGRGIKAERKRGEREREREGEREGGREGEREGEGEGESGRERVGRGGRSPYL